MEEGDIEELERMIADATAGATGCDSATENAPSSSGDPAPSASVCTTSEAVVNSAFDSIDLDGEPAQNVDDTSKAAAPEVQAIPKHAKRGPRQPSQSASAANAARDGDGDPHGCIHAHIGFDNSGAVLTGSHVRGVVMLHLPQPHRASLSTRLVHES